MKRAAVLLLLAACRPPTAPEGPCTLWYRTQVDGVPALTMTCYPQCPPEALAQQDAPGFTPDWLCT